MRLGLQLLFHFVPMAVLLVACGSAVVREPASEGLFRVGSEADAARYQSAVVRVQVPTLMDFTGEPEQREFVDAEGNFVTSMGPGPWTPSPENCANPNYAHYYIFQDACVALARGESLENPIRVREGATGSFVSPNGAVLTGRHVIRECEIYYRGQLPFYCPLVRITVTQANGETRVIKGAQVMHWSRSDLGGDGDYAVLQTGHRPDAWLETCQTRARPGESVTVLGYPMVTHRDSIRRANLGYDDADGSLRLSRGLVITPDDSLGESGPVPITPIHESRYLFTDADAVPGNSGGPVISESGCMYGNITMAHSQRPPTDSESVSTRFNASRNNPIYATTNAFVCEELQAQNQYMHLSGCPAPYQNPSSESESVEVRQ